MVKPNQRLILKSGLKAGGEDKVWNSIHVPKKTALWGDPKLQAGPSSGQKQLFDKQYHDVCVQAQSMSHSRQSISDG